MVKRKVISLDGISFSFNDEMIIKDFNLDIFDGEFITFLGPSGCGKTTILRIIGGFATPYEGNIFFQGKRINDVPAYKRNVNTIFQKYALFPHMDVYDNVAFGLRIQKKDESYIKYQVTSMLKMVNLEGFQKRTIKSLSGGQQQRVAIARALINHPKVLLLDEPLGALDLKLRKDMQTELKNIQKKTGITFIFVTHDQEEALSMSDTVIVLDKGTIQQIGSPQDIYNEPKNAFVADFIGESNIIDGIMHEDYVVEIVGQNFKCLDKGFSKNQPVDVVIRPEDIKIVPPNKGRISGIVTSVTFIGVHYEIIVDIDNFKWMIQSTKSQSPGDKIGITIDPDAIHVMKKSSYSANVGDYSAFSDEMYEVYEEHNKLENGDTK